MNQGQFTRSSLFQPPANRGVKKQEPARRSTKRKKTRWKDRVAPKTDGEDVEPKEDIIDEAILTRCTRCPAHRNRTGRFRPLIGNQGEHVCDDCYQREFPATAMLDDVDKNELQLMGKRATNFLRNKITDNVADIVGITRATTPGDAAIERENDNDLDFPSEIECRMCLERAFFRRCCDGYYCHSCYFKSGRCPGCEVKVHLTGIAAADMKTDPGKLAVGLSWALSFLLVLLTVICIALALFNAYTTPTTLWGHKCRGWFPVCDLAVCIDYDGGAGYGEGGGFIPAAQPYEVCDRSSSSNMVIGSACIYDREMYTWSNHLLGYDLCASSLREEGARPRNVSSLDPLLLHVDNQSGVYVFDDDFELPLKDAWTEIINGDYSRACGVNNHRLERGNHGGFQPMENKNALVFTGVHARHAVTVGLDIEFGGRLEFYLKMGPIVSNKDATCKTAFSDVTLEYFHDNQWTTFATYPAWKYRGQEFHFISQDIPSDAWSNSTQFRFRQVSFDVLRDHWAIDDVRILSNLKPQWEESDEFGQRQNHQNVDVKTAQCCYNTDQCSVFDRKRIHFDEGQCDSIPGFVRSKSSSSRLKLSELFILFMGLAAISKLSYRLAVRGFTRRALPINQNHVKDAIAADSDKSGEDTKLFPRQSFHSHSHLAWQYTLALILLGVFAGTVYRILVKLPVFDCDAENGDHADDDASCETDTTFIFACFVAGAFDLRSIGVLLAKVFLIELPWKRKPLRVVVDLHPERGFLCVGSKTIPLSEVSGIKSQSSLFHGFLSAGCVLGGLPFALGSLTINSFNFSNGFEQCTPLLGCVALMREIFGPSLFVKLYLSTGWVLAHSQQDRDELGRSVLRKGLLQQSMIGSTLAPVVVFSFLSRRVESVSAADNFFLFLASSFVGGLLGLLLGIAHGLPVIPDAKLAGLPSACCCVVYYDRVNCPCLFSCAYCGEIHSRQVLLVVSLDDMFGLKRLLQGNPSNIHNMSVGEQ